MAKAKSIELTTLDDLKSKASELEKRGVDIFKSFYVHDVDLDEEYRELVAAITYSDHNLLFRYIPDRPSTVVSDAVLFDENNFPYRESTVLGKTLNEYPYYDFDRGHGELYDVIRDAWDKGLVPESLKEEFLKTYEEVKKAYREVKLMKEKIDSLPDNVNRILSHHAEIKSWGDLEDESDLSYRFQEYWKATYEELYKQKNPRGKYNHELAEIQEQYENEKIDGLKSELRGLGFVEVVAPEE